MVSKIRARDVVRDLAERSIPADTRSEPAGLWVYALSDHGPPAGQRDLLLSGAVNGTMSTQVLRMNRSRWAETLSR